MVLDSTIYKLDIKCNLFCGMLRQLVRDTTTADIYYMFISVVSTDYVKV